MGRKRWKVSEDSVENPLLCTYYITAYDVAQYMRTNNIKIEDDKSLNESHIIPCVMEKYKNKSTKNLVSITIEEST